MHIRYADKLLCFLKQLCAGLHGNDISYNVLKGQHLPSVELHLPKQVCPLPEDVQGSSQTTLDHH
jgi:hypothetical protein